MIQKELVRFNTAGSVDNGKSTLIGRLLYDSGGLPEDVIAKIAKQSDRQAGSQINLATFTDGLKAEREQGITIDASYRFFSRGRRDFIVADTPGHLEYTRNMLTAATHSDITFILVDATKGIVEQNKRHTYIASLLGVEHLVVLVNKMDSVGFSKEHFEGLKTTFEKYLDKLGPGSATFIPISALNGDNVVLKSEHMPWYAGPSIMEYLQSAELRRNAPIQDLRFVVQWIDQQARTAGGSCEIIGQLVSGQLSSGDTLLSLPAQESARIRQISVAGRPASTLASGGLARLSLANSSGDRKLNISRGDILARAQQRPLLSNSLDAEICWMDQETMQLRKPYILQSASRSTRASIEEIRYRTDINNLEQLPGGISLNQNDLAHVHIRTAELLPWDMFAFCKQTGSFILIDPENKRTVATGVIKKIT